MNNELQGVVVDPTHGGADFGITKNGIQEKDITLELSNYIRKRLENLGIDTIVTRNDDITISPNDRINKIKNTFGDRNGIVVISIGLNDPNKDETNIIYSINETDLDLVNNIKNQLEYEGLDPVNTIQQNLPSDNMQDANILQRELENAKVIIVDYGNVLAGDNFKEITEDLFNYAEGVVRGIAINYGIAYEEPLEIKNKTHVVTKGESLYSIAQEYDTTISAIKALNNLKSNILSIGQILKLPNYVNFTKPAKDITIYNVKKGDTLYNIAQQYGLEVDELIEYNQLFNTVLTIGQQLIIPVDQKINDDNITYLVKSGDTLYSIAKKFNVKVDELMNYNNLDNNMISIDQQLSIPNTQDFFTYYVRTGDTLLSIAQKFNTTVESIKRLNNLSTNDIAIGQILIID